MKNVNSYLILVKKYFRKLKTELFAEVFLENYNNRNIYIRIDFFKKARVYKLSFIDLEHIESNDISVWINSCNIEPNSIFLIENIFNNLKTQNIVSKDSSYRITVNVNVKNPIHLEFNRFLPLELYSLTDFFIVTFNNCPKKYEGFFFELISLIIGNSHEFTYNDEIKFDILKTNLKNLFIDEDIEKGNEYYKEGLIKFLEKIENKYYAIIEGVETYVIILEYNEKDNIMKVFSNCSCHFYCKHIAAIIIAIRDNYEKRFYKLTYNSNKNSFLEKLMNYKFFLCIGLQNEGLKIISKEGNIEIAPLLDINHKCSWSVIEDDNKKSLSKKIKTITLKNLSK